MNSPLRNRGVNDVAFLSIDGLTGFPEAIHAVYPDTNVQRYIVHQIHGIDIGLQKVRTSGIPEGYSLYLL